MYEGSIVVYWACVCLSLCVFMCFMVLAIDISVTALLSLYSASGKMMVVLPGVPRVTASNRAHYCAEALRLRLHEFDRQVAAVRQGMAAVVPISIISLLTPRELETMVCGEAVMDVELLKSVTEFHTGLGRESELVKWLWEVIEEMNQVSMVEE